MPMCVGYPAPLPKYDPSPPQKNVNPIIWPKKLQIITD